MSEQDFRNALRRTMDTVTAPPPMSDATVLEAAHRDRRRRRTMWASVGTAAVVAAIAVGVVLVAPSSSGGDGVQVGNQPPAAQSTQDVATPTSANEPGAETDSTQTLPPGMTDRIQQSGPHYERGVALAVVLDDVVTAAGFGAPGDLEGAEKSNYGRYVDKVGGVEKWSYGATTPVTKGSGVGEMSVHVNTTDEQASGCAVARMLYSEAQCTEVTVDGKKVGVSNVNDPNQEHIDQVAAYRHDDGTAVYVAQSLDYGFTDLPQLTALPFTPQQLAALALDDRFTVTD